MPRTGTHNLSPTSLQPSIWLLQRRYAEGDDGGYLDALSSLGIFIHSFIHSFAIYIRVHYLLGPPLGAKYSARVIKIDC